MQELYSIEKDGRSILCSKRRIKVLNNLKLLIIIYSEVCIFLRVGEATNKRIVLQSFY